MLSAHDKAIRDYDKNTCDCGHWLKAADKRYGYCEDCGVTLPAAKAYKRKAVLLKTEDGYDFWRIDVGTTGWHYWNILEAGSKKPTSGYPDRLYIESMKNVKF